MNLLCSIFLLCFLQSIGQAREDSLLNEYDVNGSHHELKTRKTPTSDVVKDSNAANLTAGNGSQYVGEECCNISTTPACKRKGGNCIPLNNTCYGEVYHGHRHCVISNLKSCKCCVPIDCDEKTLSPCRKLNGTCIGAHEDCDGRTVSGKEFCGKGNNCKCCFPEDSSCPQYHDECFQVGNEWFTLVNKTTFDWYDAFDTCHSNGYIIAEPEDPIALGQYLMNNLDTLECQFPFIYNGTSYSTCTKAGGSHRHWCSTKTDDANNHITGFEKDCIGGDIDWYWLGARTYPNNNTFWHSTGELVGPNNPWILWWSSATQDYTIDKGYTQCLEEEKCLSLMYYPARCKDDWCLACTWCDGNLKTDKGKHICECKPLNK